MLKQKEKCVKCEDQTHNYNHFKPTLMDSCMISDRMSFWGSQGKGNRHFISFHLQFYLEEWTKLKQNLIISSLFLELKKITVRKEKQNSFSF